MFLLLLAIGFVIKYIWWIVGAAALVGLCFAGRALVRYMEVRRELAAERQRDLKLRADRQHRWTIAGDSRGVYGAEGASAMQVVSPPPVMPPTKDDDDDPPAVATMAATGGELAALAEQTPSGWEWALFTSVLVQRQNTVLPRLRDSELGFTSPTTTRVYSGAELEPLLLGLIDEMVSTARQAERFMAAPAFMDSFGANGSSGDAEAITHIAHRLMDYHERFLTLSESCRRISAPSYFDNVVADCGRLLNRPLEGYRDFIAELVDVIESLPKFLPHAIGNVDLGSIALDIDIDDAPRVLKRLRTLSR
ncbi:hypothetical protein TUM20985_27640 [Mycobacterium antarcticum]|nr:hypothetical protein TUM20985_27640 [Mycolicibacterium sp. TUM20985]GLP75513.1 hypothetical protein TUM20983_26230 [Mycolicibacterium sp. TUM20983]GLP84226.1 hypothetical protein TUM20984_56460 [Mycolicibacterium sp. TUM20984]